MMDYVCHTSEGLESISTTHYSGRPNGYQPSLV